MAEKEIQSGTMHDKDSFRERVEEFLETVSIVKLERDTRYQEFIVKKNLDMA